MLPPNNSSHRERSVARSPTSYLVGNSTSSNPSSAARSRVCGLTRSVLSSSAKGTAVSEPAALIEAWQGQRQFKLDRCRQLLADLKPLQGLDMAMLSVLLRELRSLV